MQFIIEHLQNSSSLTHELVESLRSQIIDGDLQPGTRLPAAKEIEQQAGVSRSVVREAFAALKAEGLMTSRQGVGNFVAKTVHKKVFAIEEEEFNSLEQCVKILELSMAVESEMVAMAANNRSQKQMAKIWQYLASIENQIDAGNDAAKEEFLFHTAIAEASANAYFIRFIKYIGSGLTPLRKIIVKFERSFSPQNCLTLLKQEYRNIAQAIDEQNAEEAQIATRMHFTNRRERYLQIVQNSIIDEQKL